MVYVTGSHLDYKYTEGEGPGVYRGETVPRPLNKDFKIGHYGRLGRLGRCHVTQNRRDLLPSSFWDSMLSPGFSS